MQLPTCAHHAGARHVRAGENDGAENEARDQGSGVSHLYNRGVDRLVGVW